MNQKLATMIIIIFLSYAISYFMLRKMISIAGKIKTKCIIEKCRTWDSLRGIFNDKLTSKKRAMLLNFIISVALAIVIYKSSENLDFSKDSIVAAWLILAGLLLAAQTILTDIIDDFLRERAEILSNKQGNYIQEKAIFLLAEQPQ